MKPFRRIITLVAVGGVGVATWQVGSSLVKDVRFAAAEEKVATARADLTTANDMSNVYKAVNHAMENSVVHITVMKKMEGVRQNMRPQDLFRFFGPDGQPQSPNRRGQPQDPQDDNGDNSDQPDGPTEQATGSGVIMDATGGEAYIVTNNHVVSDATEVDVTLNDGRRIEKATVVGTDPKSDVAVVKIKADRIIAAKWGNSDQLEKGDVIVAFGSPFGFVGSMSHGIVSALNRDQVGIMRQSGLRDGYENFIQVDAAINPGNSGGPLCNVHGEVVGINTAIASRTGSFAGIGFAIPSNQAKGVYEQIKTSGKVTRGYLGVGIADIHSEDPKVKALLDMNGFKGDAGVLVSEVLSSSPAWHILQPADVVTELNGKPFKSMTAFRNEIAAMPPGTAVKLKVWRDDKFQDVDITLAAQPDSATSLAAGGPGERATPQPSQQMGALGLSVATPTAEDLEAAGLPGEAKGVIVKQVRPNSVAFLHEIHVGDLITRIGSTPVATADEAKAAFAKADTNKGLRIDLQSKQGERLVLLIPKKAK